MSDATRLERLGWAVLRAERFALGAALGLWVADAMLLAVARGSATWMQWALGLGAAAFVVLTTAAVLGAIVLPVLLPTADRIMTRLTSGWGALRRGEVEARHDWLARVLALPVVLAVMGLLAYQVGFAVVFGFARADTMAAAMAVAMIVFSVVLGLAWSVVTSILRTMVDGASRVRGLRSVVARAWPVPALLSVGALAVAVAVAYAQRKVLGALPWREAAPLLGVVGGLAIATYLPMGPRWLRSAATTLTALVFAAGLVAAMRLRRDSGRAQSLAFDRALSGRLGYAAWTFATDFDRDGQIGLLGGGDCAPFDPRRYTGAPDLPGNGIDEDCDGSDLSPQILKFRATTPVPPGVVPPKPMVILVTVDALAAPKLAAIGGRRAIMPRVDELANRSMLFTQCFSQGPSTRMSFPSMFTSRWDSELGFEYSPRVPYSFSEKEHSLQDSFDDAEYDTVAVIPDIYFDPSRWPSVTRGFKRVDSSALGTPDGKHDAAEVTDAALRILSENRERPLYLWLHYYDAHPPYGDPPGVKAPHADDTVFYDEELAYIDKQLGRLIDAVDHRSDPTYLVLTSDHATSFYPIDGVRRWNYGYDIYTSTLHVPLIIHGPGIPAGRVDHVVSTMDVAPTLGNLLGLPHTERFDGTSLVPELLSGATDDHRVVFHEYYLPENEFRGHGDPLEFVSVRTDRYDLILNRDHGTYELYDWSADYWEEHDLYAELAGTPVIARIRSLLAAFQLRYAGSVATKTPATTTSRIGLGHGRFPAIDR